MTDFASRRTTMVDTQVRPSDVTKFPIIDAMLDVAKETYLPSELREAAYVGENIELPGGRVVLEPRNFAKLLDALDVQKTDLILDIGCCLGYSTAVLAHLGDTVVAVEEDEDMAQQAQTTLSEQGIDNAAVLNQSMAGGAAKHGPYDVIMLQGAVAELPAALLDQLKDGGRIGCIFMDGSLGVARIGHKRDGEITWRFAFNAGAPVLPGFNRPRSFQL
jgi:protein-L-isoaspartate(D-aspartate) O-methyltransferase